MLNILKKIKIDKKSSISKKDGEFIYNFLKNKKIKKTLETGFGSGISTAYIISATKSNHIAIDPFEKKNFNNLGLENIKKLGLSKFLRLEKDFSHNVLPKLLDEGIKIDFAFIDGMHLFDYIMLDLFYIDKLLNNNGYILFHDNWMPSTRLVSDWIKKNRKDYKLIHESYTLLLFQKINKDIRKWNHFIEEGCKNSRISEKINETNFSSAKNKLNILKNKLTKLKNPIKTKYFCIGYPKTGTTTLETCFKILGFKTIKLYNYFIKWFQNNDNINKIIYDDFFSKSIENTNMFSDWPFHIIYKELDKKYPDSKFILTIRKNKKTWEKSLNEHIRKGNNDSLRKIWKIKNLPLYKYNEHIKEVKKYFKNRPDDLLILCFEKGDGWEKLCKFLKKEIPDKPFPHINKGDYPSSETPNKTDPINKQKIFCIGLNKTGTKSLSDALNYLNINTIHDTFKTKKQLKYEKENKLKLLSTLNEFQGFSDYPINKIYKELDKEYPNSKFILTIRNLKPWLKSRENHIKKNLKNPNYKGNWTKIDIKKWIKIWSNHKKEVKEYFKDRPNNLLIINICNGDGWEKLCHFLNKPIPNKPFPHKNKSQK